VLNTLRNTFQPNFQVKVSPRYSTTHLALTEITHTTLQYRDLRIANPQMILTHNLPITPAQLSPTTHTLESYDFERQPRETDSQQTSQNTISKRGTLNSLVGFITVDFGEDCRPARRGHHTSKYGPSLGPSFSSHSGDDMAASNWPNPIILLQHPIPTEVGDIILIQSNTTAYNMTPSYTISVSHQPISNDRLPSPTQTIHLDFSAIYSSPTNDRTTPPLQQLQDWDRPIPITPALPPPPPPLPPYTPLAALARAGAGQKRKRQRVSAGPRPDAPPHPHKTHSSGPPAPRTRPCGPTTGPCLHTGRTQASTPFQYTYLHPTSR
jgi:hypothetical protein